MKIYAYKNHEGDKGIVIAETEEKAAEIFHKEYPDKKNCGQRSGLAEWKYIFV